MLLKLGGIYTLTYSAWKTNFKIYAFILWGSMISPKIHALNLGAKQLTTVDRAKLVHTIVKLSKVPNANVYTGQLLYRIFVTYCKPQVAKCYRTYFHANITGASILNYGVNKKEDFSEQDLKIYNPYMYDQAKRDFIIRILDMYSGRGLDMTNLRNSLATIQNPVPSSVSPLQQNVDPNTDAQDIGTPQTTTPTSEPSGTPDDELGGLGY